MRLAETAIIPSGAVLAEDVVIGPYAVLTEYVTVEAGCTVEAGVVFAGDGPKRTVARRGVRIAAGAVIGSAIELGWGCHVLPGSVVHSSVPANAVVQGNPARIVGYTTNLASGRPEEVGTVVADASAVSGGAGETSILKLGIGAASLHRMLRVADLRGALTVGEIKRDLPFAPQRYFMVFDVPSEELRGEHAHR